jgi:hypothetical protein
MNASKAFLLNNGGAGGGGGASQSFAVFKDYGANVRFDVGLGLKVAIPAPPAGKMRLWTGQFPPGAIEGMQRFLGFAADAAGLTGAVSGQIKFAGISVGAPVVSVGTVSEGASLPIQQFLSAPGEAWEFDVASFDPPATGISWNMSWRDFEGFIPVRVAPTFPAVATLIPVVLAGRVSVVGHPGIVAEFSSVPNVIVHNRDTVQHSYRVPQFSPGVAAAIGANTQGPVQPGDMVSLNIAYSILGEGASVGIEQLEATVTTPSMAFCCYQDLPLTP